LLAAFHAVCKSLRYASPEVPRPPTEAARGCCPSRNTGPVYGATVESIIGTTHPLSQPGILQILHEWPILPHPYPKVQPSQARRTSPKDTPSARGTP